MAFPAIFEVMECPLLAVSSRLGCPFPTHYDDLRILHEDRYGTRKAAQQFKTYVAALRERQESYKSS